MSARHARVLLCFCPSGSLVNQKGLVGPLSLSAPSPVLLSMSEGGELPFYDVTKLCKG